MMAIPLPIVDCRPSRATTPEELWTEWAQALTGQVVRQSRPRVPQVHLVPGRTTRQLFVVNGSRLYDVSGEILTQIEAALALGDQGAVAQMLAELGLDAPPAIDDQPVTDPPLHALSLAVAQKCNLACTYCYAQQGGFGGPAKDMSLETACRAIDLLLHRCSGSGPVNLAFLGGEPLANRLVLRQATRYAADQCTARGIALHCSVTTNGTLLTEDDAAFFEEHGFAVTISLDGRRAEHDQLRPFKGGSGSFDHILARAEALLKRQRRMQVSARVTVTPENLNLPETLDYFINLGFHTVGFSPLLRSPSGRNEMDEGHLLQMLAGMIACGLAFERHVLRGRRYPFLNMTNALHELHRGTHRPYPCGAGAGYLGVSAEGDLAACHRFVGDAEGAMGNLESGIDRQRQGRWLASRHVHFQQPCNQCWARYLCGGGCHHEVLARGRPACDFIRGWLHYTLQAYARLSHLAPDWFQGTGEPPQPASAGGGLDTYSVR
jgi:uncharacterized protein